MLNGGELGLIHIIVWVDVANCSRRWKATFWRSVGVNFGRVLEMRRKERNSASGFAEDADRGFRSQRSNRDPAGCGIGATGHAPAAFPARPEPDRLGSGAS